MNKVYRISCWAECKEGNRGQERRAQGCDLQGRSGRSTFDQIPRCGCCPSAMQQGLRADGSQGKPPEKEPSIPQEGCGEVGWLWGGQIGWGPPERKER